MGEKIKIDAELKNEWEKKLEEAGLGEHSADPAPEEVSFSDLPSPESLIADNMKDMLDDFSSLPGKLQEDILEDVKRLRDSGESLDNIKDRTRILVSGGRELADLDVSESDRNYRATNNEEAELKREEELIEEGVEEFVKKLEERLNSEKEENKKETVH